MVEWCHAYISCHSLLGFCYVSSVVISFLAVCMVKVLTIIYVIDFGVVETSLKFLLRGCFAFYQYCCGVCFFSFGGSDFAI